MKTYSITDKTILESWIKECKTCTIAFADTDNSPYCIPMNFAYDNDILYLHSGPHGKKIDILAHNKKIAVLFQLGENRLVWQHPDVACSFSMRAESITGEGTVEFIESLEEKKQILDLLMQQYTGKNFTYSLPALQNVVVWKIKLENLQGKSFGNSIKKND